MIIGTRLLKLKGPKGETDVPVRINAPEEKNGEWICRYEIDWPNEPVARWGSGLDSVEAIFRALQMIGIELYGSDYHKANRLWWLEPGLGYGFPVTNNVRDLLVGLDKRYL